eukprot:snap_masked-scaffold_18-processed-gene-6.51-mRNA-1 protein AED:1.00 eAED:1.00 QI:0/0/0/0/1/1/2/0/113
MVLKEGSIYRSSSTTYKDPLKIIKNTIYSNLRSFEGSMDGISHSATCDLLKVGRLRMRDMSFFGVEEFKTLQFIHPKNSEPYAQKCALAGLIFYLDFGAFTSYICIKGFEGIL